MFNITVMFGPGAWTFNYATEKSARAVFDALRSGGAPGTQLDITDDYGKIGVIKLDSIHGVLYDDADASEAPAIDMQRRMHVIRQRAESLAMDFQAPGGLMMPRRPSA